MVNMIDKVKIYIQGKNIFVNGLFITLLVNYRSIVPIYLKDF